MKLSRLLQDSRRAAGLCRAALGGTLAVGMLASIAGPINLHAQESAFRSSAEPRIWPTDERQRPRYRERATHRGFEVATGQIVVIAMTSPDDARRGAELATQAWNDTATLADHWTSVHRQPNFAQGAVQVVIDGDRPPRDKDLSALPAAIGRSTQVSLHISPGDVGLEDQQGQLRQAVASAFLHTAEIDQKLPQWVSQGLAAYVAVNKPEADRDNLAAARVQFLMEGNDGRYAGPFFDLIREQLATARADQDRDFQRRNGKAPEEPANSAALEQFVGDLTEAFEQWKLDPQIGQPLMESQEAAEDELQYERKEMAFVLKLADRFAIRSSPSVRTKVATFERGRREAVPSMFSTAARPPSLKALFAAMTADGQPSWATIGVDGKLIWSHEREKLRELLGADEQRYEFVRQEDRWGLARTISDGRKLTGWLEPDPKRSQRLLAKFKVAERS